MIEWQKITKKGQKTDEFGMVIVEEWEFNMSLGRKLSLISAPSFAARIGIVIYEIWTI